MNRFAILAGSRFRLTPIEGSNMLRSSILTDIELFVGIRQSLDCLQK